MLNTLSIESNFLSIVFEANNNSLSNLIYHCTYGAVRFVFYSAKWLCLGDLSILRLLIVYVGSLRTRGKPQPRGHSSQLGGAAGSSAINIISYRVTVFLC